MSAEGGHGGHGGGGPSFEFGFSMEDGMKDMLSAFFGVFTIVFIDKAAKLEGYEGHGGGHGGDHH